MGNVSLGGTVESPSIVTPQVPMTPDGYDEEIDYDTVHALNGFLRTQIGRYMRVEQLVGSNTIQDRYGFLVGSGNQLHNTSGDNHRQYNGSGHFLHTSDICILFSAGNS